MASFSDLSQEVVDLIATHFLALQPAKKLEIPRPPGTAFTVMNAPARKKCPHSPLPSLSTISTEWKRAIERPTFRSFCLTSSSLDEFARLVVGRRQGYVRCIQMTFELAPYDVTHSMRMETEAEQKRNSRFFTQTLQQLFKTLASWDHHHPGMKLELNRFFSPSDIVRMTEDELLQQLPRKMPQEYSFDRETLDLGLRRRSRAVRKTCILQNPQIFKLISFTNRTRHKAFSLLHIAAEAPPRPHILQPFGPSL